MHQILPSLRRLAFAAALPFAGALHAADLKLIELKSNETLVVPGKDPQSIPGQPATFVIDARQATWFQMLRANTIVTLFNGSATAGRKCPFINLQKRNYAAEEIERDIYHVQADANQAEMDQVRHYGCVVTTKPDWSKIKTLPKGPA